MRNKITTKGNSSLKATPAEKVHKEDEVLEICLKGLLVP